MRELDLGSKWNHVEKGLPKERMSDEELGNLISAVGNHEAKAITHLVIKEGIIYSRMDLYREIIQKQGKEGWAFDDKVPFGYCEASLAPIGLVVKEALDPANPYAAYGYMKTEYGNYEGDILSAALLKSSFEHPDFSLLDFFAQTASASKLISILEEDIEVKKRAPITRLKIFWELATSELPITQADLIRRSGKLQESVGLHLTSLENHGVINYETTKHSESFSFYQSSLQTPEKPPSTPDHALTNFVYSILNEHPSTQWSIDSLTDRYLIFCKQQGKKEVKKETLRGRVSKILSYLLKNGSATREKFSKNYQSEITLTDLQGRAISDLLTVIDRFQNRDPKLIEEAKNFKNELFSNPDMVSVLLRKAKEHSTQANQKPLEESMSNIFTILYKSQTPLTNQQVRKALEEIQRRHLNIVSVRAFTSRLVRQGELFVSKEKGINKYTINPLSQKVGFVKDTPLQVLDG